MKVNNKFFLQGIVAIIALIALISCPDDSDSSSSDDTGGGGNNNEAYIVYGDAWHNDINVDALYMQAPNAPHVLATADETGGHSNAEGNILKVDFSGLTADGWNGINAHLKNGATVNLSGFSSLSFYAKADSAATKIKEFLLTDGAAEPKHLKMVNTTFTTEWQKYTIPILSGSFLSNTNVVFQLVHDYPAGGLGVVYLDDILFDTSQPPIPTSITLGVETLDAGIGEAAALPTTITLVYDNYSIVDPTGEIVTWSSSDTSVATVEGNSVTGVAAGSATLTATLLGTTVTADITVNVAAGDISTLNYTYVDPSAVFILPAGTNHVLNPEWSTAPTATYASTGTTALPGTFALDANTGVITITNPAATAKTEYTITATAAGNYTGTKATTFQIQIISADTDANKYVLFGSTTNFTGEFFAGYEDTMTATEATDAANNNRPYMLLADTQRAAWSAGGYQPIAPINQSDYRNFVVEVRKADGAQDTESQFEILLKYDADGKAGPKLNITGYDSNGNKVGASPVSSTMWTIYKIPLADLKNAASDQLTFINLEFPYQEVDAATATGYKIEVVNIYLEK